MDNFESLIIKNIKHYKKNNKPIDINFRQLIPHLNNPERATHLIHTYPAKVLMHIPYFFLNNEIFSKKGDKVLDSFCGSGTVLLEALISGRKPIGADANPLARLLSRTKTRIYNTESLKEVSNELIKSIDKRRTAHLPAFLDLNYWFLPHTQKQLSAIAFAINKLEDATIKDFFNVCFSNLIKKVSLADPRISVPVRLNPTKYSPSHPLRIKSEEILNNLSEVDVVKKFGEIVNLNIKRFEKLSTLTNASYEVPILNDARALIATKRRIYSNSIQLILSSPPYAGAQKYIRSSSLSLGWLGYIQAADGLRKLDGISIGRENFLARDYQELHATGINKADTQLKKIYAKYPARAHIASKYLLEMTTSLLENVRVLKSGGYLILVVGNNQVCGEEFETQEYLTSIAESLGLDLMLKMIDDIKSYGLMTKRNKTADIITREYILVFKKN